MTKVQVRVLEQLNYGHIRLTTNWDSVDDVKSAFLGLQKSGHIEKKYRRWYITSKGKKALEKKRTVDSFP